MAHQSYNLDRFGRQIDTFKHLFNDWIKQSGWTYNTYAVLYSLAVSESGFCTQKEIADEWLIAKQTVFNICKDFHEKGWIELRDSPHDKRERLLILTKAGRAQAEPMMRLWNDLDEGIFTAFGQEKAEEMFALLSAFSQIFKKAIEKNESRNNTN